MLSLADRKQIGLANVGDAKLRGVEWIDGDGLPIQAFLTLPPGRPEKGLPLIVLRHGGPAAHEEPGFDWWAQALAGVSLEQGVYRCAVSVAGIADLRDIYADEAGGVNYEEDASRRYLNRYLAVSGPHDGRLEALSPLQHAEAIHAPVLLIHGRDDTVVRFSQSQAMYDALRQLGRPVQLVVLKSEDHWLSRSATRQQMLQAAIDFLKANNPPD